MSGGRCSRQNEPNGKPAGVRSHRLDPYARFEDRPDSDLDIMIVSNAADPASHERIAETFRQRLFEDPELTGLKPSVVALTMDDLKALMDTRHSVWVTAERDAKVLLGRSPHTLRLQVSPPRQAG
jgi:hypothetical protein